MRVGRRPYSRSGNLGRHDVHRGRDSGARRATPRPTAAPATAEGVVTIDPGDEVDCTITNTLNSATVTVHKDFSDDNEER